MTKNRKLTARHERIEHHLFCGELDSAYAECSHLLAENPQNVRANFNLGRILLIRDELSAASSFFRTSLKLDRSSGETMFYFLLTSQLPKEPEAFRKYLTSHLDDAIGVFQSRLTKQFPRHLLEKTLEMAEAFSALQAKKWKAAWLVALLAEKLGNVRLVEEACRKVLALNREFWFARELPKHARGYYAQLGQDEFIEQYFSERKPRNMVFVEVGAFDGKHYSNVRRLVEKYDWQGLCVEPIKKNFEKLRRSYLGKNVKCIQVAVSNRNGTAEMNVSTYPHLPEWGSDVSALDPAETERWTRKYGAQWTKEKVQVKKLTEILAENNLTDIDLLSIDAEGHDFEVLEGLDFEKYKPQLIVVEYGGRRDDIIELLSLHGYSVVYDNRQDLFFADIPSVRHDHGTTNLPGANDSKQLQIEEIRSKINPHLFNINYLPKKGLVKIQTVDPTSLINTCRFDVMAKIIYGRFHLLKLQSNWGRQLYLAHLYALNGFFESDGSGKVSAEDFLSSFHELCRSFMAEGFNEARSLIPVGSDMTIIDGSHRLALGCLLKKNVRVACFNRDTNSYNYTFFRDRQLDSSYADAMAYEYSKIKKNTYIITVFPTAEGKVSKVLQIIRRHADIFYSKDVHLHNNGPHLLIKQMYRGENWLGNWSTLFRGAKHKAEQCFRGAGPVRVFLVEANSLNHIKQCKEDIRQLFGVGNHSVHINDTHEETVRLAQIFFNENSLHFLNNAQLKHFEKFYVLLDEYNKFLSANGVDKECFCIDGSSTMAVYGIRPARDIDYLHYGYENILYRNEAEIGSHNSEIKYHDTTIDDIIFNPHQHFYYEGLKFVSLRALSQMKTNRGEKKDTIDVELMAPLLKTSGRPTSTASQTRAHNDIRLTMSQSEKKNKRSAYRTKKIVGLVTARNEANIIEPCLRSLSLYTDAIVFLDDASEDNTVEIVKNLANDCNIEAIIKKDKWHRDEPGDRNRILQYGRKIGGTHFIVIDADEMFTANCAKNNFLRHKILELQPGERISLVWIQLWRSVHNYRFDDSVWTNNYKGIIFCDDGKCSYESAFIHTPRIPQSLSGRLKVIPGYTFGLLHFQFVNWRNLLIKQSWYRCLERIREPGKSTEKINALYAPSKDENNLKLKPAPAEWFAGYMFFDESRYNLPDHWRETQVLNWFNEYGLDYFSDLDIWDIDWGKKIKNGDRISRSFPDVPPLISAIVSTYNAENLIRGCLEDLENQTIAKRLEIIVVDSGSQQKESTIIRQFQQRYGNIKYLRTEKRETVYAAWNRGIKAARGKYVTNANTDDRHRKDAFEVMSTILETLPEISLVYADVIITETENERFEHCTPVGFYRWMNFDRDDLLSKGCFVGPQPMWRREIHDEYGYFDGSFVTSGDYEFWLRISQTRTFLHIPVLLGLYLKSPGSIEHSNRNRQAEENRRIFEMYNTARSAGKIINRRQALERKPAAATAPTEMVQSRYQGIQRLVRSQKHDEAVEKLVELTKDSPLFAPAYNDLGVLYHHRGEREDALASYRKAVEIDPENTVYQKNLADFYCVALGEIEKAMGIYVGVLNKDPFDTEALLAMGHICLRLERLDDAHSFYERVLKVDPNNRTALESLQITRPEPEKAAVAPAAESMYTELLSTLENDPAGSAIEKITAFIAAFPDFAMAHNDLAVLYHEAGAIDKARRHYVRAVHLAPDNPHFQKNLADFTLVELDRKREALAIYRDLVNKRPRDTGLLLMAGHISLALNQLDEAAAYYRRLLAMDPGNDDARQYLERLESSKNAPENTSGRSDAGSRPSLSGKSESKTTLAPGAVAETGLNHPPLISILIPAAGPVKQLRRCLESVDRHTSERHEIIIIDNGMAKGSAKWLRSYLKKNELCRQVSCESGTSMAAAFNVGIAASRGEFILRLYNDVQVTPGWLAAMCSHFNCASNAGVIGAMSNAAESRQETPCCWNHTMGPLTDFSAEFHRRNRHRRIASETVDGFCLLMRRELIEDIGVFDEEVGEGGYEAEDLCLRAALNGYQNFIAGDVYLHRRMRNLPGRSKKYFNLKWSGTDGQSVEGKKRLVLSMETDAIKAWQAERIHEAGDLFLKAIGLLPGRRHGYLALTAMLIQTRQFEDALHVLSEMPRESQDVSALVMAVVCEAGLGHNEKACKLAAEALLVAPHHPSVLNIQGVLALGKNDMDAASKWFQRSLEADPGFGEAHTNLAMLHGEAGDQRTAFDLYENGFILSPADHDIASAYHNAISQLNAYERARPIVEEGAAAYPHSKKIRYMSIDILLHLQAYSEAMGEIEAAMADFGVEDGILATALKLREKLGTTEKENTTSRGLVSLCMIVKNEEQYLAKCLSSVKPVVDEIIVVDTGSSDRSPDIARAFGARVDTFDWSGDFAAARNHALSLARGEVIFVMDADEALSPLEYGLFRRLCRQSSRRRQAFVVNTRNYTLDSNMVLWEANEGRYGKVEAGTGWTPSAKIRIFPNDPAIRFDFPVHEMVEPSLKKAGIAMKPCHLQIHHYGKLDRRKTTQKGEMYYQIGRQKLNETGCAPVALRELAVQAEILKKHAEAVELWHRYIAEAPHEPRAYIYLGISYCSLGRFDKVLETAEKALALLPDSKEGHYHFALAKLHLGYPEQALASLEKLCGRLPEYLPAQFLLAAANCAAGNKETAMALLDKLSRTAIGPGLAIRCHELAKGLLDSGRPEFAKALAEAAIDSKHADKEVLKLYAKCAGQGDVYPKTGTYER